MSAYPSIALNELYLGSTSLITDANQLASNRVYGLTYVIGASITDPVTGQSFIAGDKIFWFGTLWQKMNTTSSSSGDVVGPVSSVAHTLPSYADTTGRVLEDISKITVGANNTLTSDSSSDFNLVTTNNRNINLSPNNAGNTNITNGNLYVASSTPFGVSINAINNSATGNAYVLISTSGASAGDCVLNYYINGVTSWVAGIDNSDSDAYVVAASSNLGANNALRIGTDLATTLYGTVKSSAQPAFSAYLAAPVANATGDGTVYQLGTDALTKIFDNTSSLNTNGTFTAPVTGKYFISASILLSNVTTGSVGDFVMNMVTTARTYSIEQTYVATSTNINQLMTMSRVVDMTSGDTCIIEVSLSGQPKTTTIFGDTPTIITCYQGYLLVA